MKALFFLLGLAVSAHAGAFYGTNAFTPNQIPGRLLALDPRTTPFADGTELLTAPDSSGMGQVSQVQFGFPGPLLKLAIINGNAVWRFNGSKALQGGYLSAPQPFTTVYVVKHTQTTGNYRYFDFLGNGAGNIGVPWTGQGGGDALIWADGSYPANGLATERSVFNGFAIRGALFSGESSKLFFNSHEDSTVNTASTSGLNSNWSLGANWYASGGCDYDHAYLGIWKNLSDENRRRIERWLAARFAITLLP